MLCGETVRSCRKVPDPRDLGGRRPLFYLVGLFSHLNQIKQLVTWSQSALSTIASPDLPAVHREAVKRRRPGSQRTCVCIPALSLQIEDHTPRTPHLQGCGRIE